MLASEERAKALHHARLAWTSAILQATRVEPTLCRRHRGGEMGATGRQAY